MLNETKETPASSMTAEQFAHLGGGHIAYVKPMLGEEAIRLFPQVQGVQPGLQLFALCGADGSPLMLTDSRDAAIANAWEQELRTVSLH